MEEEEAPPTFPISDACYERLLLSRGTQKEGADVRASIERCLGKVAQYVATNTVLMEIRKEKNSSKELTGDHASEALALVPELTKIRQAPE